MNYDLLIFILFFVLFCRILTISFYSNLFSVLANLTEKHAHIFEDVSESLLSLLFIPSFSFTSCYSTRKSFILILILHFLHCSFVLVLRFFGIEEKNKTSKTHIFIFFFASIFSALLLLRLDLY